MGRPDGIARAVEKLVGSTTHTIMTGALTGSVKNIGGQMYSNGTGIPFNLQDLESLRGPPGPPGPQGFAGPRGEQGEPGIPGEDGWNPYRYNAGRDIEVCLAWKGIIFTAPYPRDLVGELPEGELTSEDIGFLHCVYPEVLEKIILFWDKAFREVESRKRFFEGVSKGGKDPSCTNVLPNT